VRDLLAEGIQDHMSIPNLSPSIPHILIGTLYYSDFLVGGVGCVLCCVHVLNLWHMPHILRSSYKNLLQSILCREYTKNSYKTSKIYNIFSANYGGNHERFNLIHYKQMMLAIRVAQNVYFLILTELLLYPRNCLGS
jgi:hypothetical protein